MTIRELYVDANLKTLQISGQFLGMQKERQVKISRFCIPCVLCIRS